MNYEEDKKMKDYKAMAAQARFKGIDFDLTFEEYKILWGNQYHLRGLKSNDMCMYRIDPTQGFSKDNIKLGTRKEAVSMWQFERKIRPETLKQQEQQK